MYCSGASSYLPVPRAGGRQWRRTPLSRPRSSLIVARLLADKGALTIATRSLPLMTCTGTCLKHTTRRAARWRWTAPFTSLQIASDPSATRFSSAAICRCVRRSLRCRGARALHFQIGESAIAIANSNSNGNSNGNGKSNSNSKGKRKGKSKSTSTRNINRIGNSISHPCNCCPPPCLRSQSLHITLNMNLHITLNMNLLTINQSPAVMSFCLSAPVSVLPLLFPSSRALSQNKKGIGYAVVPVPYWDWDEISSLR